MLFSTVYLIFGSALVFSFFWLALRHAAAKAPDVKIRRTLVIYAAWLSGACLVAQTGYLSDFSVFPPRMMFLLAGVILTSVLFARSKAGVAVALHTPLWALVGFQGFRIVAELALYQGMHEGKFPVQMTFEGWNFDIATGILALVLIPILKKQADHRVLTWVFNITGLILLTVIVVIAVLSMPTPFRQFMNEPANTAVAGPGHVLLPASLVQAALTGHLLLTRRLRQGIL